MNYKYLVMYLPTSNVEDAEIRNITKKLGGVTTFFIIEYEEDNFMIKVLDKKTDSVLSIISYVSGEEAFDFAVKYNYQLINMHYEYEPFRQWIDKEKVRIFYFEIPTNEMIRDFIKYSKKEEEEEYKAFYSVTFDGDSDKACYLKTLINNKIVKYKMPWDYFDYIKNFPKFDYEVRVMAKDIRSLLMDYLRKLDH